MIIYANNSYHLFVVGKIAVVFCANLWADHSF